MVFTTYNDGQGHLVVDIHMPNVHQRIQELGCGDCPYDEPCKYREITDLELLLDKRILKPMGSRFKWQCKKNINQYAKKKTTLNDSTTRTQRIYVTVI